jgi:hypothetical protein
VKREPLDAYSDVFSLGAVLWELLTGQKLFSMVGRDDMEIMTHIKNAEQSIRPPSKLNPEIPKELDDIVMKALAPSRFDRYQTAEDFQKALRSFIVYTLPGFGYQDVAQCVRSMFQDEMKSERESIRALNLRGQQFLEEHTGQDKTAAITQSVRIDDDSQASSSPPAFTQAVPVFRGANGTQTGIVRTELTPLPTASLMPIPNSPFVVAVPPNVDLSGSWNQLPRGLEQKPSIFAPTRVKILLAALYIGTIWLIKADRDYMFFERFLLPSDYVRMASMDPPARRPASLPSSATSREALLKLNIAGETRQHPATIYVNNQRVDTPLRMIKVPMDQKVALRIERKGIPTYRNEFMIRSSQYQGRTVFKLDIPLKKRR